MAVLIVVHPHPFDDGILREVIPEKVKESRVPALFVPDGDKKPYGGPEIYDGVLKPDGDKKLGRHGRAPLRDEDAEKILEENDRIYLAGGNLSECIASTYNSLVTAAEENSLNCKVGMVQDLVYLQAKKSAEVHTLKQLIDRAPNYLEHYLKMFRESDNMSNELVDSSEIA